MPPLEVVSLSVSDRRGTRKSAVEQVTVDARGIVGDAHAGPWHRQVSVLARESVALFEADTGRRFRPGELAENMVLDGAGIRGAGLLDRFHIGSVRLEVAQIGKPGGEHSPIFRQLGRNLLAEEGLFCRVLSGGTVRRGDTGEYLPRTLDVRVITLSDRAAAGQYEDRAGPRVAEIVREFFAGRPWRIEIATTLLPDDPQRLRAELTAARDAGADVVFTTGGTGVGPRDRTPEVVGEFCDRLIPGIMEHIRVKFGQRKPNALLSRSVAGLAGTMQVYALPGSVRAVEEYTGEILKTLEHAILMAHGINAH